MTEQQFKEAERLKSLMDANTDDLDLLENVRNFIHKTGHDIRIKISFPDADEKDTIVLYDMPEELGLLIIKAIERTISEYQEEAKKLFKEL